MPADHTLDALARAARALLADRPIVALHTLCAHVGIPHALVTSTYLATPHTRAAFEQALDAHCVDAEGGCFLIR